MLKSRIITGVVLALTVLAAIYLLPLWGYALFFYTVGAVAAWEYAGLAGMKGRIHKLLYVCAYALLVLAVARIDALREPMLLAGAAVGLLGLIVILTYPASSRFLTNPLVAAIGLVVCAAAWTALMVVRSAPGGSHWILWMILVVAFADIGAYFTGRAFGRRKLAPAVSPGKTWEGFWGGMAFASLVCGSLLAAMGRFNGGWIFIMIVLVVVSVVGDLFESVLKRTRGVKDSGNILPGHGGALDRLDSALAVLPYFALILVHAGLSD